MKLRKGVETTCGFAQNSSAVVCLIGGEGKTKMAKMRKGWLETRIVTSRVMDWCDEEEACRERAAELGIELDECSIEREIAHWRRIRKTTKGE